MCWGSNSEDQIRGTQESRYGNPGPDSTIPVEVSEIPTAVSISSGNSHSCALLTDGKVMCWGLNDHKQLGGNSSITNATARATLMMPISLCGEYNITTATAIALGYRPSCALLYGRQGEVLGFQPKQPARRNSIRTMSFGEVSYYSSVYCPAEVSNITTTATGISLGSYHSCAVLTDGRVMCWGKTTTAMPTATREYLHTRGHRFQKYSKLIPS